jgi:hypothetical protein
VIVGNEEVHAWTIEVQLSGAGHEDYVVGFFDPHHDAAAWVGAFSYRHACENDRQKLQGASLSSLFPLSNAVRLGRMSPL